MMTESRIGEWSAEELKARPYLNPVGMPHPTQEQHEATPEQQVKSKPVRPSPAEGGAPVKSLTPPLPQGDHAHPIPEGQELPRVGDSQGNTATGSPAEPEDTALAEDMTFFGFDRELQQFQHTLQARVTEFIDFFRS